MGSILRIGIEQRKRYPHRKLCQVVCWATIPAKAVAPPDPNHPDSQENAFAASAQEPVTPAASADKLHGDAGPIQSESLLRGRNEIQILHRGELYRLCLTRAGKLILHK